MAQDPLKVDQIQIEPGAAGTRQIDRDPGTGGIRLSDGVVGSGLTLAQLAGLQNVTNVLVVGTAGAGAAYTSIQDALNAVPNNASATNPYLVLVMSGVYTETVNITKDGIYLVGVGRPTIESALEATPNAVGNDHTVIISEQLGTNPLQVHIEGFTITNAHDNKAAIRIVGGAASTMLSGGGCLIRNTYLDVTAAGGNRAIWASTAGKLTVEDSELQGSGNGGISSVVIEEMDQTSFQRCAIWTAFFFRYDTAEDEPAGGSRSLALFSLTEFTGGSSLIPSVILDCDGDGVVTMGQVQMGQQRALVSGGRTHSAASCHIGELSITETPTFNTAGTYIDSIVAANAGAVLKRDTIRGSEVFAAAQTVAVVFDIPQPDGLYDVALEVDDQPVNDETPWVTAKVGTGFTINFATNQTLNVGWRATR